MNETGSKSDVDKFGSSSDHLQILEDVSGGGKQMDPPLGLGEPLISFPTETFIDPGDYDIFSKQTPDEEGDAEEVDE